VKEPMRLIPQSYDGPVQKFRDYRDDYSAIRASRSRASTNVPVILDLSDLSIV